jgi:hypothetical protein
LEDFCLLLSQSCCVIINLKPMCDMGL